MSAGRTRAAAEPSVRPATSTASGILAAMPRAPLCVTLVLAACSPSTPAPTPEAEAGPARPDLRPPRSAPVDPAEMKARVKAVQDRLAESRAITDAHAAGALGDRLAPGELVLVDARVPAATRQVQYFLITGARDPLPATVPELRSGGGASPHNLLQGGDDAARPALFRAIKPGTYTACAAVGPPRSAAEEDLEARTAAAYRAEHGESIDPAKLRAVADRVRAESGLAAPVAVAWDAVPLRCKTFEVTADVASRVVVLPGAPPA